MKIILICIIQLFALSSFLSAQIDAEGVFIKNKKYGLYAEDESILLEAKYDYIYYSLA